MNLLLLLLFVVHERHRGEGDLHSPRFAAYRKTIALTSPGMFSDQSPTYSLSLYPTDEFFHVYTTANPVIATVGSVCIIIFTSILFLLYDFFVRQESHHKRTLLQAKRQFIRFVRYECTFAGRCVVVWGSNCRIFALYVCRFLF